MRVLVLGADGYLGWATCMALSDTHEVFAYDDFSKRELMTELGVRSLFGNEPMANKCLTWAAGTGRRVQFAAIEDCLPDAVIHYAEQPSAPYSMRSRESGKYTVLRNIGTTLDLIYEIREHCPDCHIIKLGTMGEYGTPDAPITEWIDVDADRFPMPKRPGSLYHTSKVMDSDLLDFACRVWGLRATDLHQGVVYGWPSAGPDTKCYYDGVFGTVLNRFLAQAAVGHPLTVYGRGGQTRGILDIRDTLQCVRLALENPAAAGEYRILNQFAETASVLQLAQQVAKVTGAKVESVPNPRLEAEVHRYEASNAAFRDLGMVPLKLTDERIEEMAAKVKTHADAINEHHIMPRVRWQ